MSKNKDAKRKAKQKAKLAQAAQQEQARIEHIANAVMEICSPLEPDYIDDSLMQNAAPRIRSDSCLIGANYQKITDRDTLY